MDMETVIGAFEYFGGIAPAIVGSDFLSFQFPTIILVHYGRTPKRQSAPLNNKK
jgi:hypothetical protein